MKYELLTVSELAAILKVSNQTVYDWVHQRKIKPIKIGRLIRFNLEIVLQELSS